MADSFTNNGIAISSLTGSPHLENDASCFVRFFASFDAFSIYAKYPKISSVGFVQLFANVTLYRTIDKKLLNTTFNLVNFNVMLKTLGFLISEETKCELRIDERIKDHRSYNVSGDKFFEYFEPLYYLDSVIEEIYKNEMLQ